MLFPERSGREMDYSEFDALPSKTDEISISEEPSHDGIRDMPS